MPCNCGKNKVVITSAQAEEMRAQAELAARMDAETAKAASGEHGIPCGSPGNPCTRAATTAAAARARAQVGRVGAR
jgi:hypothetical protein